MNSTSSSSSLSMPYSAAPSTTDGSASGSGKKVRKPYTITKSRESWTEEEHDKFLEALQLFDRDWKKIEDFVGSKTVIQIRSHAQKYFLKVQKNGTLAHVPPPRPKRKAAHPYPQKAPENADLAPVQASIAHPSSVNLLAPGYTRWDDGSMLVSLPSSGALPSQDNLNLTGAEAVIGPNEVSRSHNSKIGGFESPNRTIPAANLPEHGKHASLLHGLPDFAVVYSFIGSVFDPTSDGHMEKLKEMDPINFETVLLLMRNLTINLSSPDFEPIKVAFSSYEANTKYIGVAGGQWLRS